MKGAFRSIKRMLDKQQSPLRKGALGCAFIAVALIAVSLLCVLSVAVGEIVGIVPQSTATSISYSGKPKTSPQVSVTPTSTVEVTFIAKSPVPTSTITPTPLPTNTPRVAVVTTNALNVRGGPGISYDKVGSLKKGTSVEVIGQIGECAWIKVKTKDGHIGWVSGKYVDVSQCNTMPLLPTLSPTPTATLTPTPPPVPRLPLAVSGGQWSFTVDRIEALTSIAGKDERVLPERDVFFVLIGTVRNNTNKRGRVTASDWSVVNIITGTEYPVAIKAMEEAKRIYHLDYPGVFNGISVNYESKAKTYVVFDVPRNAVLKLCFRENTTGRYIGAPYMFKRVKDEKQAAKHVSSNHAEGGGVALTVNKVFTVNTIDDIWTPSPGHTFLVVDVTIQNLTRDECPYNPLYFTVRDSQGYEYDVSLVAPSPSLNAGTLYKGEKVRGNIAFEVPVKARGLVITYEPVVILGGYEPLRIPLSNVK